MRSFPQLVTLLILGAAICPALGARAQTAAAAAASPAAVDPGSALVKAFNAHDAKGVASFWKEDAVHVDDSTGERIEGRAAIEKSYADLFKQDPQCQLKVTVASRRQVDPNVATSDGTVEVIRGDGTIEVSAFTAIMVQQNGKWLIDQVHESDEPLGTTEAEEVAGRLAELDWLVGRWTESSASGTVTNEVRWADPPTFLVLTYRRETGGAVVRQGTQIIGWNGAKQSIHSWLFDGEGGVGDADWHRNSDNQWAVQMKVTLPDGRRGSFIQIFDHTPDDALKLSIVDREMDGELQPNIPSAKLVRSNEAAAK